MEIQSAVKFQIFVGHNHGTTGQPLTDKRLEHAFGKVAEVLGEKVGGATFQAGVGVWGTVREDSTIITVISDASAETVIIETAEYLKRVLQQNAVLVTRENITTLLI
jgi:hypothetical protein